jgi:tight adherence protein C
VNRLALLVGFLVLVLALGIGQVTLLHQLRRQTRLKARLHAVGRVGNGATGAMGQRSSNHLVRAISAIGMVIVSSGLLSRKTMAGLEQTLASAGVRGPGSLGLFVGSKLLLLFVMPLLTLAVLQRFGLSPMFRNTGLLGAALIGLLGPDWWMGRQHKKYIKAIALGLPDALDLMVICAQAGLGFEPAINRVATEIRHAHPAISREFGQTASELRVAADSKVALTNMGIRTGLESVKRMTSMLVQTMQYGTPLSDALRVLSAEMRQEMLIRFETRAARLPVLLTIPMILFILPCIFLIVGGPAVILVRKSFHH